MGWDRWVRLAAMIIAGVAGGAAGQALAADSIRTAVVDANGKLLRGKGAASARLVPGPPGFYEVKFAKTVAGCTYIASNGNSTVFNDPGAFIVAATASPFDAKTVVVKSVIAPDTRANTAFSLLVAC